MAVMTVREVIEGTQYQGADEQIAYTLDVSNWGSTPSSTSAKIFDVQNSYSDVTGTNMTGATSVTGDVITTPTVQSLVAGKVYRAEVKFTLSGNVFEAYFNIHGQR